MICAPRLLKCGKPFADYGFTTFQQPLLLLRRQRKPLCLLPCFRRLVVLTKGSTLASVISVRLVDHIPAPSPPKRRRGHPKVYSDRLFLNNTFSNQGELDVG